MMKENHGEIYTVIFDTDGGSSIYEQEVEYGYTVKRPTTPTKNGYVFDDWTLDGEKYDFSEEVNKDITLVATWLETYTVTFNSEGKIISTATVKEGDTATPIADPKRYGYEFIGWKLDKQEYDFETKVLEDLNLIASWKEKEKHTVTFVDYDKTYFGEEEVYNGEKVSFEKTPIREGYAFVCWTLNEEEYMLSKAVTKDLVLVAKYRELEEYEVVFDTDGELTTKYVLEGSKLEKPTDPSKDGYVFDGWLLDSNKYDFDAKIEKNIKLTASWVEDKYTISITAEDEEGIKRIDVYKNGIKISVVKLTKADGESIAVIYEGTSMLVDEQTIEGVTSFKATLQSGIEIEIGI